MPRKQKKYHYIYKTTNIINGKYYIGMHSTDNLNDGYIGSGKYIRKAYKKYGRAGLITEILQFCDNRIELKNKESEIVNEILLRDRLCMNYMLGGEGGDTWTGKTHSKETKEKLRNAHLGKKHTNATKSKISKKVSITLLGNKRAVGSKGWVGKKHTKASVDKMRKNHPLRKAVLMCDLNGNFIKRFESMHEAEKISKTRRASIAACCDPTYPQIKTRNGYTWKYE